MKIFTGVKLELLKLRHTGFWVLHMLIIIGSTLALNGYYRLYDTKDVILRIKMIYEFVGILIPVFSSISIAFLVKIEEQVSNMYGILSVRNRKNPVMGMLLVSWSMTLLQLLLQTISLAVMGRNAEVDLQKLLLLGGGMMIFSFFYHLFHLFLNLRFGIGVSIFFGVFECKQSVMYSNIRLAGAFRYIPFAWLMEWKTYVLAGELREMRTFWIVSLSLLIIYLIFFMIWFEHWEGKKNYGE